jgi:hypothetical protein
MGFLREQRSGCNVGPSFVEGFFLSDTTIDAATIQAYRETEYRVDGDQPFILRIGEQSPVLAALHKRHRVDCSAYVTACNPYSQALEDAANAQRHAELGRELRQRSLAVIEGLGQHPSNGWEGEASSLVLGLTLEAAKVLGARHEQNAIVWSDADAVPQLILLR